MSDCWTTLRRFFEGEVPARLSKSKKKLSVWREIEKLKTPKVVEDQAVFAEKIDNLRPPKVAPF